MTIEQIYTGCLAQAAYFIESGGEVAIIDPMREVQPYIEMAEGKNAVIKYIFETHFHADFVSGHVDLAKKTGATIIYGPTSMKPGFDCTIGSDGQQFKLGDVTITLIHTPGHTMESSCYLLSDENGKGIALFSGDTLFIGDVGRPDLAQHVIADLTQEKLAAHLYDSLRNKIMPLSDDIIVYPAHGAGSACGKHLSTQSSDTLGHQKETNYALQPALSKDEFIRQVLTGLTPPPAYFPKNVLMNINGYETIDTLLSRGCRALDPEAFERLRKETGALVLDTRPPQQFAKGFIPGSINIGIDGSFAVWVGTLVPDIKQPVLLVTDKGREEEVVTRLARVGYEGAIGYLSGGYDSWKNSDRQEDTIPSVSADELVVAMKQNPDIYILDVRKEGEYSTEHVEGALNVPLDFINTSLPKIDKSKTYYVHCAAGYRSMAFVSILQARGFNNLVDVDGGFKAIKASGKFEIIRELSPAPAL